MYQVQLLRGEVEYVLVKSRLVLQVHLRLPTLDLVEGWLRNVQIAAFDHWPHVTEEKGQKESTDMRPIHIRIGHNDDAMIADLLNVKIITTNPSPKSRNEYLNLLTAEHLFEACLLNVENLPPQRENRLKITVAPLLC